MSRAQIALIVSAATLVLTGCIGESDTDLQGYVEGTYVYVSAENAGLIVERPVAAGDVVEEGDLLARLDDDEQREAVAGAKARLAQAKAQLANLLSGQRAEEISVIAAHSKRRVRLSISPKTIINAIWCCANAGSSPSRWLQPACVANAQSSSRDAGARSTEPS